MVENRAAKCVAAKILGTAVINGSDFQNRPVAMSEVPAGDPGVEGHSAKPGGRALASITMIHEEAAILRR